MGILRPEEHAADPGLEPYSSVWTTLRRHTQRMPLDHYREANRANWDARVPIHYGSDEYGIARFISDPAHLSVVTYDKEKLGDVTGKSLLHLQCHIGTDTISGPVSPQ